MKAKQKMSFNGWFLSEVYKNKLQEIVCKFFLSTFFLFPYTFTSILFLSFLFLFVILRNFFLSFKRPAAAVTAAIVIVLNCMANKTL